jgi:hypothetical protein
MYSKTLKIYSGNVQIYFDKPYAKVPYLNEEISRDKPTWYFSISNIFNFAHNFTFNCDFNYQSKGDDGFTFYKETYNLSAGLLWKIFKKNIHLSVRSNDILRTVNTNSWEYRYGNITTVMNSRQDHRHIRLGLRYNFNNIRSNIRNKANNQGEINRL